MAAFGIVIGAILAVIALTRVVWSTVKNVYMWAKRMETYAEYIDSELRHNGGDSLRDEVCRQGKVLDEVCAAGRARDARIGALERQVVEHVRPPIDDIHHAVVEE